MEISNAINSRQSFGSFTLGLAVSFRQLEHEPEVSAAEYSESVFSASEWLSNTRTTRYPAPILRFAAR